MNHRKMILILLALAGVLALLNLNKFYPPSGPLPAQPVAIHLDMAYPPRIGDHVRLTVTMSSVWNASNLSVNITLSDGLTLISGSTSWKGQILGGHSLTLNLIVSPSKYGLWTIRADAGFAAGADAYYKGTDVLFVDVEPGGTTISHFPPVSSQQTARTA